MRTYVHGIHAYTHTYIHAYPPTHPPPTTHPPTNKNLFFPICVWATTSDQTKQGGGHPKSRSSKGKDAMGMQ